MALSPVPLDQGNGAVHQQRRSSTGDRSRCDLTRGRRRPCGCPARGVPSPRAAGPEGTAPFVNSAVRQPGIDRMIVTVPVDDRGPVAAQPVAFRLPVPLDRRNGTIPSTAPFVNRGSSHDRDLAPVVDMVQAAGAFRLPVPLDRRERRRSSTAPFISRDRSHDRDLAPWTTRSCSCPTFWRSVSPLPLDRGGTVRQRGSIASTVSFTCPVTATITVTITIPIPYDRQGPRPRVVTDLGSTMLTSFVRLRGERWALPPWICRKAA